MITRKWLTVSAEGKLNSASYAATGSFCEVHNLYQTKPDERGRTSWTEQLPDDLVKPAENAESSQYALIVRNAKCYDGRKALEVHSIVVQSSPLKRFLSDVMKGYPGITMALDRVEFNKPFKPFIHRWIQFTQAKNSTLDSTTKAHVDLLYRVLEEELQSIISSRNDLIAHNVITHDLLWTIFEPDDAIFSVVNGRQRAFLFSQGDFNCKTGAFDMFANYIDFDGSNYGYESHKTSVPFYEGTLSIPSLPAFPLSFHSNQAAIKKDLIDRGKRWEDHKGYHYRQYEGLAHTYFMEIERKFSIHSRVIIDTEAYNTFNTDDGISFDDDDTVSTGPSGMLTDTQRLVATPVLRGYSLKDKKWLEFYVDGMKDIVWNSQAFDSLVLPDTQQDLKQLILAFADAQSKDDDAFDDIIKGKGRGIVVLLSGPPGVGKTLTAESVAEVMKVPLYVLSAGDLGTSASKVEETLKGVLDVVPRWRAVLLLDEADVFMEARNSTDLTRTELVSIFLRMLEYFEVSN